MKQKQRLRQLKPQKQESPPKAAEKSEAAPQQADFIAPFIQRIKANRQNRNRKE